MLMNKNIYLLFSLLFLFALLSPIYALEVPWPEIAGIELKEDSTMQEFTSYFFAFSMIIGSILLLFAVISAGFTLLLGHGSPSDFQNAKNKLLGAAIGMILLLGGYVIINEINSDIVIESPEVSCLTGIERKIKRTETTSGGRTKEYIYPQCLKSDNLDIALESNEELLEEKFKFDKCIVREIIVYEKEEYKGEKKILFEDRLRTNENCPDFPEDLVLDGWGSVKIIYKREGVYLYGADEDRDENSSDPFPLFFNGNVKDFNSFKINNKVSKIEHVSLNLSTQPQTPDPNNNNYFGIANGLIVFSETSFRGKCLSVTADENSLERKDLATGEMLDMKNNISSMIYFETPFYFFSALEFGLVKAYAVPNCHDHDLNKLGDIPDKGKYETCSFPIVDGAQGMINKERSLHCPAFLTDKGKKMKEDGVPEEELEYFPVQSIKIEGNAGVILKSNTGDCHYMSLKTNERRGNCITNLQDVLNLSKGGKRPVSIMVFPLSNEKE